jgi:hypothetical protein
MKNKVMKNSFFFDLLRFGGYLFHSDFAYWHHEAMVYVVKVSEEIFTSSGESSCTRGNKIIIFYNTRVFH